MNISSHKHTKSLHEPITLSEAPIFQTGGT
nr:MAG TPA: hypothetical protein [Caudoviricetes sp.]